MKKRKKEEGKHLLKSSLDFSPQVSQAIIHHARSGESCPDYPHPRCFRDRTHEIKKIHTCRQIHVTIYFVLFLLVSFIVIKKIKIKITPSLVSFFLFHPFRFPIFIHLSFFDLSVSIFLSEYFYLLFNISVYQH